MLDLVISNDISRHALAVLRASVRKVNHINIVYADSLAEGLQDSKSEFICFVGKGVVSPNLIPENLDILESNPLLRKMSMVASTITNPSSNQPVYGYTLDPTGVHPVHRPASRLPYMLEVGYVGGAIIRRYCLNKIKDLLTEDSLKDSYIISTELWLSGNRCLINPSTTYVEEYFNPIDSIEFKEDPWGDSDAMKLVRDMWFKEVI